VGTLVLPAAEAGLVVETGSARLKGVP